MEIFHLSSSRWEPLYSRGATWTADAKSFLFAVAWSTQCWGQLHALKDTRGYRSRITSLGNCSLLPIQHKSMVIDFQNQSNAQKDTHVVKWHRNPGIVFLTGLIWVIKKELKPHKLRVTRSRSFDWWEQDRHFDWWEQDRHFSGRGKWKRDPKEQKTIHRSIKQQKPEKVVQLWCFGISCPVVCTDLLQEIGRHQRIGENMEIKG